MGLELCARRPGGVELDWSRLPTRGETALHPFLNEKAATHGRKKKGQRTISFGSVAVVHVSPSTNITRVTVTRKLTWLPTCRYM